MELIGLKLPLIKPGSDLVKEIMRAARRVGGIKSKDVLVVSSKVVSTAQGRLVDLSMVKPSARAKKISKLTGQKPQFVEVVLREADRVLGATKGAILTLKFGMLCANAGVDGSNSPPEHVVLMPLRPDEEAASIRRKLKRVTGREVGVVISDSNVKPLRAGTVGQAVGVSGIPSVLDCRGELDLYGKPLKQTFRAIADQLSTAAQILMGEGAEEIPVVIVRGLELPKVKAKISPKIRPRRDLYSKIFRL